MSPKKQYNQIYPLLKKHYPNPKIALNYTTPLELVIAVSLSAQCTDVRVNLVTEKLFKKYRTAKDYYSVLQEELEQDIKSTGFYRNKAKNIQAMARRVEDVYHGEVPDNMEDLLTLAGVARKTANVVLGELYGKAEQGITVDTHVMRLSKKMGLVSDKLPKDAVKVERELLKVVPVEDRIGFTHRMITHGRALCKARKPNCSDCFLADICPGKEV